MFSCPDCSSRDVQPANLTAKTSRKVSDSLLQLDYEIWGEAPLQALGKIADREFYFRCRHNEWSFEVALENGDLPSDVGAKPVFYRTGKYENASYMPIDKGIAIIKRLAAEFVT
jgi:hypothetical protein